MFSTQTNGSDTEKKKYWKNYGKYMFYLHIYLHIYKHLHVKICISM